MRNAITHPGAANLIYEIREIVEVAKKLESLGLPIIWENIGDPVAKGEQVAPWIKEYVKEAVSADQSYAYSPTKGLQAAREYIAKERNLEGGIQITADDILFFNGLGDAISKVYKNLHPTVRVIGPNPAYPTHSGAEAAHADRPHITYSLNPEKGWQPDLAEMEQKIHDYPEIAGILIVNPDNPTGYVYTEDVLRKIVDIARRHNLFIITDEIYSNLTYGVDYKKLAAVIGDVPALAMRGISKEFPWPGGRCGWVEFYNRDQDNDFDTYTKSLIDAKMLEVCSTTLPQQILPEVMSDERYYPMLKERTDKYQKRAEEAEKILGAIPELIVHKPNGAFYMTVVFKEGILKPGQTLSVDSPKISEILATLVDKDIPLDKRFCYYLLASTGLCVVPLTSGFNSSFNGFRFTLLEQDDAIFSQILNTLAEAIRAYINS
ncbi:MAG: pyridoxal phosphate-dependent aminotransferase [Candidatus Paceibacterota bacterium]